jgi:hypothetical protein
VVNVPDRRNPEAWHAEKSEIAHELRRIAKEVEKCKAKTYMWCKRTIEQPTMMFRRNPAMWSR